MTSRPTPGDRRRTPDEFDALLDGGASGDRRLDEVLSAARGPAQPHELAASAPALGAAPTGTPSRSRRVLTRLGTATVVTKVATGAVGAAVVGAAAVAGATHHLPGQTRPHAPRVAPSTSTHGSDSGARSDTPSASTSPTSSGSLLPATTTPVGPSASSGAAGIPALCRVWLALPPGSDAVRSQPRFVVLVRAAGSVAAVDGYCRSLPTRLPSGSPSSGGSSSSGSATGSVTPSPRASPSSSASATPRRSPSGSVTR